MKIYIVFQFLMQNNMGVLFHLILTLSEYKLLIHVCT